MTEEIKPTIYMFRLKSGYDILSTLEHPVEITLPAGVYHIGYSYRITYNQHPENKGIIVQLIPWAPYELVEDPSSLKLACHEVIFFKPSSSVMHKLYDMVHTKFLESKDIEEAPVLKNVRDLYFGEDDPEDSKANLQ